MQSFIGMSMVHSVVSNNIYCLKDVAIINFNNSWHQKVVLFV